MASSQDRSLGTRTIHGMLWAYGSYVGGRGVVLVSTSILAHLLTPADFGVVALALVFMTFIETVKDLGLTQALVVASPEEEPARAQTTFVWTVAIGAALALIVSALGPLVADFFNQPSLTGIVPVLALSFFVESLGATHDSLARKHMDYRKRATGQAADVFVRGAAGIALALLGFGAWSLVLGYLVGALARTATLWVLVSFRPQLRLAREHLSSLARLGGTLTIVDVGAALVQNIDYLFVGGVLGAASLGLYTMGFRLPELLIMNLAVVAADVLFPAYSALKRDQMENGFLLSLRYLAAIVFPMGVGLALLAHPFVLALFGSQWHQSVAVMQILVVYAVFNTLNIPAGSVYKTTGRAWILAATTVPHVLVLAALLAFLTHLGIITVAICMAAVQVGAALVSIVIAGKVLPVAYRRIAGVIGKPLIASLGMGVLVFPIAELIERPWPALIAGGVVGVVAYTALLWHLAPDIPERLRSLALPRLGRRAPVEAGAPLPHHD